MFNFIYRCVLSCLLLFASVLFTGCVFPSLKNEPKEKVIISKEYTNLSSERQDLAVEIETMKMKYDTLTIYNPDVLPIVDQQEEALIVLLRKLRDSESDINVIRAEIRLCRDIQNACFSRNAIGYSGCIDYSFTPTSSPNVCGIGELATGPDSASVGQASVATGFSVGDFQNVALRVRHTGASVETDRAAKAETIRSCFKIRKNAMVEQGKRTLQMALVSPDGQVLTGNNSGTTSIQGEPIPYSESRVVDYRQANTEVCIDYTANKGYEYKKGSYAIYIYEGGRMIGRSSIALK